MVETDIEVARYALRTFTVDFKRRELRALTQGRNSKSEWEGGTCVARCRIFSSAGMDEKTAARHVTPQENCSCGVYGTINLQGLKQFGLYAHELVTVIAVEGTTIIGDTGLRTQAARVVAYWSPSRSIRKICEHQCVDATSYPRLDDMLTDHNLDRAGSRIGYWKLLTRTRLAMFIQLWCLAFFLSNTTAGIYSLAHHHWWHAAIDFLSAAIMVGLAKMNRAWKSL